MPSSAQDRARSAKACAGERKTCPETASGQDLEAVRMRVARSSEGMTAMVDGANRAHSRVGATAGPRCRHQGKLGAIRTPSTGALSLSRNIDGRGLITESIDGFRVFGPQLGDYRPR